MIHRIRAIIGRVVGSLVLLVTFGRVEVDRTGVRSSSSGDDRPPVVSNDGRRSP
jgi:hypothetical protein